MNTIDDIQQAINSLIDLGNMLKKVRGGPFPTSLLSILGELLVFLELKNRFENSKIFSKRKARADISIDSINIEVKTSNFKKEDYGEGYGFALHIKKCKKHPEAYFIHPKRGKITGDFCYLDYLVCVTLNESDLTSPSFYLFSREELNSYASQIENKSKRFWYAPYRILIPINPHPKQKGVIYNNFDLMLAKDKTEFKNRWNKIKLVNHN
jgi:hypothetical protein